MSKDFKTATFAFNMKFCLRNEEDNKIRCVAPREGRGEKKSFEIA